MNWSISWLIQHWYLPLLLAIASIFALGVVLNWRREKRRSLLTDAEADNMLGAAPQVRGTTAQPITDAAVPVVKPWLHAPDRDDVARGPLDAYGSAANIGGASSSEKGD